MFIMFTSLFIKYKISITVFYEHVCNSKTDRLTHLLQVQLLLFFLNIFLELFLQIQNENQDAVID